MAHTLGIDLGGTKMLAVLMIDGAVVAEAQFPTPRGADELVRAATEAARSLWSADVGAVGIGVAGLVDSAEGVFVWGPHVAGTGVPVRAEVQSALGVPVVVDNDANAGAWGEHLLGAGRGAGTMLFVTLGTGIGGAIVIDGRLQRGASFAGEFGHMTVERDGLLCACGKRGCWETLASGPALVRLATEHIERHPESPLAPVPDDGPTTGESVTAAAAEHDIARDLVAQVGSAFGDGLSTLISILDPDVVVVGGGLGSIGESILTPARRVVAASIHGGPHRTPPPIVAASLGARAGAVGAALMAAALVSDDRPLEEVAV